MPFNEYRLVYWYLPRVKQEIYNECFWYLTEYIILSAKEQNN